MVEEDIINTGSEEKKTDGVSVSRNIYLWKQEGQLRQVGRSRQKAAGP